VQGTAVVGLHKIRALVAGKEEHMSWGFKEKLMEAMSKSKTVTVVVKVSFAMMLLELLLLELGVAEFIEGQHPLSC